MVLDTHAEGVDEDTEEDALLEDTVVHDGVQTTPDPTKESGDSLQTGRETPANIDVLLIQLYDYEPHDWLLLCWSYNIEIAVQVVDAFLFLLGIHPLRQVISGAVFVFGKVKHNS